MGDNNINISKKELETVAKIKKYKLIDETNIVSILWKKQDLIWTVTVSGSLKQKLWALTAVLQELL